MSSENQQVSTYDEQNQFAALLWKQNLAKTYQLDEINKHYK